MKYSNVFDFNNAPRQNSPEPKITRDPLIEFREHVFNHGFYVDGIVADGAFHRFKGPEEKTKKSGWYILYANAGACGDWRYSTSFGFSLFNETEMDYAQLQAYRSDMDKIRLQRDQEQSKRHADAKIKAQAHWDESLEVDTHPYLETKQVQAHGVKLRQGKLIFPLTDYAGAIHSYQTIAPNGDKRFCYGGAKKGNFFKIPGSEKIAICEGYATASTLYEATGWTVIVAVDAGNLHPVAEVWRKNNPIMDIIICSDNDANGTGQEKAKHAAESIGARIVMPSIVGDDWNDVHVSQGLEAVKAALAQDDRFKDFPPLMPEQTSFEYFSEPEPPDAIINYRDECCLEKPVVGGIFAPGGTGKGFFTLGLGVALAEGKSFGPLVSANKDGHKVLMIAAEDGLNIVKRRLWDISGQTGCLPPKFHVASTVGKVGPIMVLKNGVAVTTIWYDWLKETIQNHMPLDLLVLDPKSRLSDLPENDNTGGTSFIYCLERLSQEFNISILFCHHVSKGTKNLDQNMSRGASAIIDGCRWAVGLMTLNDTSAKQFDVTKNFRDYVEMDIVKTNYGPGFNAKLLFKRDENGVLHFDNSQSDKQGKSITALYDSLLLHDGEFSQNDLRKRENGADIIYADMELNGCSITAKYCLILIDKMISKNLLIEEEIQSKYRPKIVLKCVKLDGFNLNQY
jgi:phage/plasmid primase-like uncharacterized protein